MKKLITLFSVILLLCKFTKAQSVDIQVYNTAGKMISTQSGDYALDDNFRYLPTLLPAPVLAGDKIGFINNQGNMIIPAKYNPVRKATYLQSNGKIELSNEYHKFNEGIVPLFLDGKCGALDSMGKIVVPFKYKYVDAFYNGLARAMSNDKIGFVNTSGVMVIAEQFENVTDFENGYAIATLKADNGNSYDAVLDKTGKLWLKEGQYENIKPAYSNMLVKVIGKNEAGLYNTKLNAWIVPLSADKSDFKCEETLSNEANLISYYDNAEKSTIYGLAKATGSFEKLGNFTSHRWYKLENCFAFYNNDKKYAFFSSSFKQLSGFDFEGVGNKMYKGMVDAVKNGKVGVTTKTGAQVIHFIYNKEGYVVDNCEVQPNGTITIRQSNQYWCLNTKGEKILPGPYDYLVNVWGGNTYKVKQNGKYGLIDINGKVIVQVNNDDLDFYEPNLVKIKKDNKWGFFNADGKMIIPMEYDYATIKYFDNNKNPVFEVEKGGYVGIINHLGKWVLPIGYVRICYAKGVMIAQKGMSITELGVAEVKQYKKLLASLGDVATNFEKAKNLYNNKGNCPGGCLANYKSITSVFLKEAKALRDYFNNSKTLGTNTEYSYAKTELAKIVSNTELTNNDVQNLSDVAYNPGSNNGGSNNNKQNSNSNSMSSRWASEVNDYLKLFAYFDKAFSSYKNNQNSENQGQVRYWLTKLIDANTTITNVLRRSNDGSMTTTEQSDYLRMAETKSQELQKFSDNLGKSSVSVLEAIAIGLARGGR
jgi:hypothetical protein